MPITNLQEAIGVLDGEIQSLTETAIAVGIEIFTSTEEYEPSTFWAVRKVFIELAKARQIRENLTAVNGEAADKPAKASSKRKRRAAKAAA